MPKTRGRFAAEAALRDSEARLAFAMEAHALGSFEWDLTTDNIQWSYGAEARLGLEPGLAVDFASWAKQIFPEDVEEIKAALADAKARKLDRFTFRYRVGHPDGIVRTFEGATRCIYDEAGQLAQVSGIHIDVTAQLQREAALRDREAELRSILEAVPNAMVVIDEEGVIQRFSAAAERLFGYRVDEIVGENVAVLTPDSALEHGTVYLDHIWGTGERRPIGEHRVLTARNRDGTVFPIELSVGEAIVGNARLFTGFMRDLSKRQAAEQAANDLRNELAQVGRVAAMGEMAASLAHELNQPLAATANFLAATTLLVERGADQAKVAELLALANDQIQRAGNIIRNIRGFIAKREVEIGIEPVEKTIRDSVALVLVGAARMEVEVRYAFDQPNAFMLADRVQIQQVLVNLLRNASEALQGEPRHRRTILIAVRTVSPEMIEISVSDTGPGIDARILDTIFTPLSSTKGSEGMGLGLSICRRIIEAHGGTLTAENRAAGGATFRFTLPAGTIAEPES